MSAKETAYMRQWVRSERPSLNIGCPVFQILFARAEALHAHGHTKEACHLAQQLAEEMLLHPPDLFANTTGGTTTPKCEHLGKWKGS